MFVTDFLKRMYDSAKPDVSTNGHMFQHSQTKGVARSCAQVHTCRCETASDEQCEVRAGPHTSSQNVEPRGALNICQKLKVDNMLARSLVDCLDALLDSHMIIKRLNCSPKL